jgi:hypothetical protein
MFVMEFPLPDYSDDIDDRDHPSKRYAGLDPDEFKDLTEEEREELRKLAWGEDAGS